MSDYDEPGYDLEEPIGEVKTLTGILAVIAKTGGIKISGNESHDPEKWLNPLKPGGIIPQMSAKGLVVDVVMDAQGYYQRVIVTEKQPKKQESTNTPGDNPLYINLQGKRYVTHTGLMQEAKKQGLKGIRTELLSDPEAETAVVRATVTMVGSEKEAGPRKFSGLGDANAANTSQSIAKHKIRMAETRAVNRALRFATNITECSIDELGEADKK